MTYETRRAMNDGGGVDLAAATGLLGKEKQKVVKKKKKKGKDKDKEQRKSPRKPEFDSPSKSALEQALSGFDTPSDHGGKKTPDLMAKEAIQAAEEFMRCNSVPEGLVTAKDGLAGALPALAVRHAEMRAPAPVQGRVQWEHSADTGSGKDTPGGFASFDTFGLELPQTPPELTLDPEYRQELMRASDASATKKMRSAKKSYDAKVAKVNDVNVSRHSLSPLRTDPKLAARNAAASAKAAATAHPWRGSTPELDGWTKKPYVPHAEEVRYRTPNERVNKVGKTGIPMEFQMTVDDPIFPSLEAEMMDVSVNDDGTFRKTVFPTKRPNRRSQIAALAETLDRMLEALEEADAQKQAEMDAASEQERLLRLAAEAGGEVSAEEVARRAQADVEKETASVALMIDRLEREDQVVQTVLGEMQRQIALQSKDRAKLLQRVGDHYHTLVQRAVGVSKMGGSVQDEQITKMALLSAQMDALRKKFESQVLTTEDREARISELLGWQRDLEEELERTRSKAVKAERAREKALKEAAAGRALKQENADFKHLNEDLELRIKELSNLVEETNLDVKKFKKMWEMEKGITADLTEQLEKARNSPRPTGAAFQGKRPVRAVRKVTEPTADAEKEQLKQILEQERALRAKQDHAGEEEKLAMQQQLAKLAAERLAAEQLVEAASRQGDGQEQHEGAGDEETTREMTKEEEALEDEMAALQAAMAQKAKRVKGLMSDDIAKDVQLDGAHGVGISSILGAHVDSDDDGEISEDEAGQTDEDNSQKESGAAKLAQMQLAKMQREMAATEAKLAKAHANRQRLEKEHRQMKDKLESGRLSVQEAEELSGKLATVAEAKTAAEAKASRMQQEIAQTERLRDAIVAAEGDAVDAAVAQAMQASVEHKQSAVADADESLHQFIKQEASIRQELAQLEGTGDHEQKEQQLREQLMDIELKRTELVTVRENAAADLVIEQSEAAELGVEITQRDGAQTESMDVYTVRQFERTVGRLQERAATHRAKLTRDKQRQTLLLTRAKTMKAQLGEGGTPSDEAVQIRGQLTEDEVELGAIRFHQEHETAELKAATSWTVRLEDGKRAADGASKVLSELRAYFDDRKRQIDQALGDLAIESQRNSALAAAARKELAEATAEDRTECERKLGALEAQRVTLVEISLALSDEMIHCSSELLEMQTKHAACVAMDTKDRAVQMAVQNQASLDQQRQEQSLQLQQADERLNEIASAEIKLQAALKKGALSEQDTKDAELQLRDLQAERQLVDAKHARLAQQQEDLAKAKVEFEAAVKEAKSHGTSMPVRKLVEQQLARSEKLVLDTQAELDKAEVEAERLDQLADTGGLDPVEMESIIRQKELLKERVTELSHSLETLEDDTRMRKAQVSDMRAAEVETAETAGSGGVSESHRVTQILAELEARNQHLNTYEAQVQEILLKEQVLTEQMKTEGDEAGAIASELEIIAVERERAIELRHSCAEEIKELNAIALEHSAMQSKQSEIEELAAAIDAANKQVTEFHKEELHLRRKVESGILTGDDLQQATDRLDAVRTEAHALERTRHDNSLAIQRAQEQLQLAEENATRRHQVKLQRAEDENGATQLKLRALQKEEAQLMHELQSSSKKEEVHAKLGQLAIARETLQSKLTAEASVKKHAAEVHDTVIWEKIVHVHHFKTTEHVVATEGYDQSLKLQRQNIPELTVQVAAAGATSSNLGPLSQEAQETAQGEALALRSHVGSMDTEIEELRRQLAAQQGPHAPHLPSIGKTLLTAADVFAESTQIILAAQQTVDSVRTMIAETPALQSHAELKTPCARLDAVCAKLSEHSKRIAAVAAAPATKLAAIEIQRQEAASQLAQKEGSISGANTARSIASHASSALTGRSSEHSVVARISKEATVSLDQDKAKLQEILEEERVLHNAKQAAESAAAKPEDRDQVEQQLSALARKKDEATQRIARQQAVKAQAMTQHAELLLSEPLRNPSPKIATEKAKLQEMLAKERAMRDKLNSFSISDSEKEAMQQDLEKLETDKADATSILGRSVATHRAEALLTEAVATSTPMLDREKERLQAILTEERVVRAALEAASAAERKKLDAQLEHLQDAKMETTQQVEQQLYEIQADHAQQHEQAGQLVDQLGAQNRALEDKVSTLGSSLFRATQEKEQLQTQLTETLKAVRNLKERKDEEVKNGPSQADVDAANKKMLRYRELLKVSEQDVLLAQERLMRNLTENKSLQGQLYEAQEDVAAMQQQVEEMRADVSRLKKERAELLVRVAHLEELLAATQLEAARAKELEIERDELLARIRELEMQIDEKDRLISQLRQDAAELGRKLAQAMLDLEESERRRAEAEAKMAEMQAAEASRMPDCDVAAADSLELMLALAMNTAELNKQRKAQVAAVRSDLKQAEKERDEALAALDEARKALAALQAELQAGKFADGQKDARIAELEARIAELEKALAAAQAEMDSLSQRLAAAEAAAAQAAKDAADAAARAVAAGTGTVAVAPPPPPDNSAEIAAARSENEALKKRIKELLEEIDRLTAALKETNDALAAAAEQTALKPANNDDALRALRASMAELMAALAEAQAEAARLRRLNEQLEAALAAAGLRQPSVETTKEVVHETEVVVQTETVVDEAEIKRLKQEIEDLRQQLRDALEREKLLQEELAGAKALIERLQSSQDDRDMERVQWEKEKRDEFQGSMVVTSEKGSQTDQEEHQLQLAAERSSREISRVTHEVRARHKPRFLVPETTDASHETRDCKPLRWLLRLIRSIYDDKYLADAADNRHNHPHDPLPEFIFVWTAKRYGLRGLVAQTRWDIANAANEYDDVPEVRTFLSFVQEVYDTEQLSFYLYARAVVHDRSCSNVNEKRLQDSSKRETGNLAEMRYIPLSLVRDLVAATFSERMSPNNREAILTYAEKEAVMWTPPDQEQAPAMQGVLSRSGGFQTGSSFAATQTLTSGMNATLNATKGKGTFQSVFGVGREYGGTDELPIVLDEARLLELLMQGYTADRMSYDARLAQIFAETDIDGDGEIDKDDFVRFVASAVPQWSVGHAKDVFWKVTAALGKEVLDMDGILHIAREYQLFNGALQIPKFTSEDEVLSAGELELVWNAIANHRSYLDQGFVRKMTARWQKVYKMGGSANAATGRLASPARGAAAQRYVLDTDGAIPQNALRKGKGGQVATESIGVGGGEPVNAPVPREFINLGTARSFAGGIEQWEDDSVAVGTAVSYHDDGLPVLGPSETNATGTFEPRVHQEQVSA